VSSRILAVSRSAALASGAVSAGVALGVAELVSATDSAGPSLVSAIGTEFVDRFAAPLKDLAVTLFGTNDKVALMVGIVLTSLGLGAGIGLLSARRFAVAVIGFGGFGLVGLWAYQRNPFGGTGTGIASATAAALAGVASLWLLLGAAGRSADGVVGVDVRAPARVVDGVAVGADVVAAPAAGAMDPRWAPRRAFLGGAALLGVAAVSTAALGRRIRAAADTEAVRQATRIPRPGRSEDAAVVDGLSTPGLSPYITPNADFYRIDTALMVPQVDTGSWRLKVGGLVDRPFELTFDELLAMDSVDATVTLQCVSNEIGGNLVGNATWQGVPLAALLERAGVQSGATQIVGRSVDRWTAGFPTDVALDGRTAIVAYAMNGEPLPASHGFPARLVVAGLYGYVSATKWLSEIELTTWDGFDGYWISRGWSKKGPIKIASRIDVPPAGASLAAGTTAVAGVAWSPPVGIMSVEAQIDDEPWLECRLGDVTSDNTWVQWVLDWDAAPGDHVIRVRATDRNGVTQTDEVAAPAPNGATGWHSRRVSVDG